MMELMRRNGVSGNTSSLKRAALTAKIRPWAGRLLCCLACRWDYTSDKLFTLRQANATCFSHHRLMCEEAGMDV